MIPNPRKFFTVLLIAAIAIASIAGLGLAQNSSQPTVYLPFSVNTRLQAHSISGQVLSPDQAPIAGVTISTENGHSAVTDSLGHYTINGLEDVTYTLTPIKNGYDFSPEQVSVVVPPDVKNVNFTSVQLACTDVVINGSFESGNGWFIPVTAYSAGYSSDQARSGTRSMRTGIVNTVNNKYSYSTFRQLISVPSNATTAKVEFSILGETGETPAADLKGVSSPEKAEFLAPESGDMQYGLLLDANLNIIKEIFSFRRDTDGWYQMTVDLSPYKGKSVWLLFGTYNDGLNGVTWMNVDDVVSNICPSEPVPTPTPIPGTCNSLLQNPGFETTSAWEIPLTAFPADYSTMYTRNGSRSMRTGILSLAQNKYSYSDARQTVSIPSSATAALLRLYTFSTSGEALNTPMPGIPQGTVFGDQALAGDVQYVLVLDQYGNWIDTLLWQRSNSQSWVEHTFDLKKYIGKTIKLQFGTYNNGSGGVSSMFVDDMQLDTCPVVPTPTATPTPKPTSTPGPTPTATATPSACIERITNGNMDSESAWIFPLTAFPADYTTVAYRSGTRAIRTGILSGSTNRYSYSDARQMVTIPSNATSAKLTFWLYPTSSEPLNVPLPAIPVETDFGKAPLGNDAQYVLVLDSNLNWIDTLVWQRSNNQAWSMHEFDLKKYAGRTIGLQFGSYNDGYGGITSMFLDDVSLITCTP